MQLIIAASGNFLLMQVNPVPGRHPLTSFSLRNVILTKADLHSARYVASVGIATTQSRKLEANMMRFRSVLINTLGAGAISTTMAIASVLAEDEEKFRRMCGEYRQMVDVDNSEFSALDSDGDYRQIRTGRLLCVTT